jgi:WD40 repeat protein
MLTLLDPSDEFRIIRSSSQLQDSPTLTYTVLLSRYIVCGSMSGNLTLYDAEMDLIISRRKDHTKYVVRLATFDAGDGHMWLASAGWDRKVFIYDLVLEEGRKPTLPEPKAHIVLPSNPEAILFSTDPDHGYLHLLLTRRDSTFISFYSLSNLSNSDETESKIHLLGRQNLAPASSTWVSFTPTALALCPTDPTRVAVATSTTPHMKVIIARLLFPKSGALDSAPGNLQSTGVEKSPPSAPDSALDPAAPTIPPDRTIIAQRGRDEAALLLCCNSFAPQTQYSTPCIAWRPGGGGLWVNSDDGIIRGIDTTTGRVVTKLEGHETASKIRCLWAGRVSIGLNDSPEEWLVSGGFDQLLIAWRTTISTTPIDP